MLRSIFTKSVRDYRWAVVGWGIGLGLIVYAQYATYGQLYNTTSAQATLTLLGQQFRFFGDPIGLDTPGGYAQFRAMGLVPVLLGIWTVLAGARMTRGDEQRGAMDMVLSTPQPRLRVLAQKVLALVTATVLISVLIALLIVLGMASAEVAVDAGGALMASVNAGLAALVFGLLALLLAQFLTRAAAAGWAGGLMAFFYVLDGTGRTVSNAEGLRHVSPFYYYQLSKPLVPSYGTNLGGLAVLVGLCALAAGLACPLFVRRDIGRSVLAEVALSGRIARHTSTEQALAQARRDVWVRGIGLQALRRQGAAIFWWVLAAALYAGFLVVVAKSTEKQLEQALGNSPLFQHVFGGTDIGTNNGFLAVLVFYFLPLILTIFASMIALRWATDLESGRLELVLSTPHVRWRVILERYAAVLVATVAAPLFIWLALVLFAQAIGFSVEVGRVAAASFAMLPLELVAASLVFALAGLMPPGAVIGIFSVFIGVSFLATVLKTLLHLPDWVLNLSIFHQYGNPIQDGIAWGPFLGMLGVAAVLLAIGVAQFSLRDVDRGEVEA